MDKILLKIAGVIALIVGILYCITIVGVIVGIPTIIGAVKFLNYAENDETELLKNKDTILIWSIVFIFLVTIAGVLGLVFYSQMTSSKEETKKEPEEKTKTEEKETTKEIKAEVVKEEAATKKTTTKKTTSKTGAKKTTTTNKTTPKKASSNTSKTNSKKTSA